MSNLEAITSHQLRDFFRMGEVFLSKGKEEVNALNVFPVPDGDTGTNMSLTLRSAVKNLEEGSDIRKICAEVSRGALMGARGNSGVIISQILRGMTMSWSALAEIDARNFAAALQKGVEIAYKSVLKPVEGTILTVSRLTAEAAAAKAQEESDIVALLRYAIACGRVALQETPNQLPVLKEAGVVDAGGYGFLLFLEGGLLALEGKDLEHLPDLPLATVEDKSQAFSADFQEQEITYRYCTELMIHNATKKHSTVQKALEKQEGDSLVCVGDEGLIKVHFHTNDPGKIISYALTVGELFDIKIENMKEQMAREALEKRALAAEEATSHSPKKLCGVVAVASGEGLSEVLKSLGVDEVICGGQTMNPSAEDILNSIAKVNAEEVILLPNNGNVILAAEQAQKMSSKTVAVVPTKFVTQGISVLLQYNAESTAAENADIMQESLDAVVNGEVTFAVRDTVIDGIEIKANDILTLIDGKIVASETEVNRAVTTLIEKMADENSSLLTLYYGEDVTEDEAKKAAAELCACHADWDIEVYYGGQPLYYYLISLE